MTQDPFVPPAGSTMPVAPPLPVGPAPVSVAGPAHPYSAPYTLPPLRSTAGLGTAAIVLACVWTALQVVEVLLAPAAARTLRSADEMGRSAFDSGFTAYDGVSVLTGAVQIAVFVVACLWVYSSRSTAVAANPTFRHARGPVWSWLGWWVPVVSAWFPYQVVRDIRRATSPGPVNGIGSWWGAWLVFITLSNIAGRLTTGTSPGSAGNAADVLVAVEVLTTAVMVVALVLWIRIIRDVTRYQGERIAAAQGERTS